MHGHCLTQDVFLCYQWGKRDKTVHSNASHGASDTLLKSTWLIVHITTKLSSKSSIHQTTDTCPYRWPHTLALSQDPKHLSIFKTPVCSVLCDFILKGNVLRQGSQHRIYCCSYLGSNTLTLHAFHLLMLKLSFSMITISLLFLFFPSRCPALNSSRLQSRRYSADNIYC